MRNISFSTMSHGRYCQAAHTKRSLVGQGQEKAETRTKGQRNTLNRGNWNKKCRKYLTRYKKYDMFILLR
jgi:hypothetical protein